MTDDSLKIAVIGMAGRFPGAENIDQFWHNLQTGTTGGVQLLRLLLRGLKMIQMQTNLMPIFSISLLAKRRCWIRNIVYS